MVLAVLVEAEVLGHRRSACADQIPIMEVVVIIFAIPKVRVGVFIPGSGNDAAVGRVVDQRNLGREPRPQGFF